MHLLDTNIISELRKGGRANPGVTAFFSTLVAEDIYLSVQTIGEIRRGLEIIRNRGDREQAARLEAWLDMVVADYADRILGFDLECAQLWGRLMSPSPQHPIDKQIAAIALIYDLTVVTRNTEDFKSTGVRSINPFSPPGAAALGRPRKC
ncbi:type II toxin-antitoxin system VapC family toxin [Azoarcus taiwanensis]|uniref:PIN domain-containing protein n=1 Tax=Azoarcus taiwanensis TaxID=666964 RepID=A0A972FC03_9RHOO|nr:type II toxin-antitoxin system VapC family toxin [Azoarcus taiwanensis]NMG03929.1 PIN domain-containing protein [Azoarcus taiwanensis]